MTLLRWSSSPGCRVHWQNPTSKSSYPMLAMSRLCVQAMSRPKRVAIEVEGLTIEGDLDHVVEVVEGLRKKRRWMELQPTKEDLLREDGMVIEAVEPSVRIPPSPEEIKKW